MGMSLEGDTYCRPSSPALQSDDALAEGREFYNDLGDIALSRG